MDEPPGIDGVPSSFAPNDTRHPHEQISGVRSFPFQVATRKKEASGGTGPAQ